MLGSFVMGLLAAAATLGLDSKKPVALLPEAHPWQNCPELFVGLRTGYCGSLTTFASWELSMVQLLIGGTVSEHLLHPEKHRAEARSPLACISIAKLTPFKACLCCIPCLCAEYSCSGCSLIHLQLALGEY